jgi:hypothetical protein
VLLLNFEFDVLVLIALILSLHLPQLADSLERNVVVPGLQNAGQPLHDQRSRSVWYFPSLSHRSPNQSQVVVLFRWVLQQSIPHRTPPGLVAPVALSFCRFLFLLLANP